MSKTEDAADHLEFLASEDPSDWGMPGPAWSADDAAALRHLISEARRLGRVREWAGIDDVHDDHVNLDSGRASRMHVRRLLSAPDAETEVQPRPKGPAKAAKAKAASDAAARWEREAGKGESPCG